MPSGGSNIPPPPPLPTQDQLDGKVPIVPKKKEEAKDAGPKTKWIEEQYSEYEDEEVSDEEGMMHALTFLIYTTQHNTAGFGTMESAVLDNALQRVNP